jgi:shikimate dehydrogenase
VINATPLGMDGERLPEPFHRLQAGQVAYDLVYDPPVTPFLASAHGSGVPGHHGLGMLVAQAAVSYRMWTGVEAPMGVLSAVAAAALTERTRHT